MFFIRNKKDKSQLRQVSRGHQSDEMDSGYAYRSDFHLFDSDEWEVVDVKMTARKRRSGKPTITHSNR
jgi:hypothetical protein